MQFTEFETFGWNWLTVSSIVLVILTLWQWLAYLQQGVNIWRSKSAASISITFTSTSTSVLVAMLWYGLLIESFVAVFSGLSLFFTAYMLAGALRYGNPEKNDWIILLGGLLSSTLFLTPIPKEIIFTGFSIAASIPLLAQLLELKRATDRGVVKGLMFLTYMVKNLFYVIFGIGINDWVFIIFGTLWMLLSFYLLFTWYRLPESENVSAE